MSGGKTPGQAAYEAAHPDPDGFVEWEFLPPEAHARWAAIAEAAVAAGAGAEMREMRHLNTWQGSHMHGLRELVAEILGHLDDAGLYVDGELRTAWLERAGLAITGAGTEYLARELSERGEDA